MQQLWIKTLCTCSN